MHLSSERVERRLRLGEDSRWEFKQIEFAGNRPKSPARDDLADELGAFANAEGGALLCGVTDRREPQGLSIEQMDALEQVVIEISRQTIKPPIEIETRRFEIDGKALLAVDVKRGYALHERRGRAYRRHGNSKRPMTSDEKLRLSQQRGLARFPSFDQRPVPGTGFATLNEALWRPLLSVDGHADPSVALSKMGLLSEGDNGVRQATVAGLLVCSHHPEEWLPNACITATRYRGVDRASGQVDAQTICGPLNRQISEAVAFAVRNMSVAAHKDPGRIDLPQYSERAVFEAVVNAVVHRDYSMRGSRIRLSMFSDRLEIQSPGTLPNSLMVENMADRQATRNEVLASALGRMPTGEVRGAGDRRYFMERRGDGVPVILQETRGVSGKPAQFRVVGDADLLVLLPSAPPGPSPARVQIGVRASGHLVPDVDVLVLFPNHTWSRSITDEDGYAAVSLHLSELPLTVFAAAPGYSAHLERDWTPSRRALAIELQDLPGGGAVIFTEGTGRIPGLTGTLNPIRDPLDRTYLYTSNIAVNEGAPQPVYFRLGENLRLTDANEREMLVRIVDIAGRSALVEYRPRAG